MARMVKAIIQSLRPSDFAQAFGRVVTALRRDLDAGLKAPLYPGRNSKDNSNNFVAGIRDSFPPIAVKLRWMGHPGFLGLG